MKNSALMLFTIVVLAVIGLTLLCEAQEYPNRPIDIVVPFTPGGGVDTFFRNFREPFSKDLKVTVNVVNRPGGSSVVGASFVANSRPDGYTLLGHDAMVLVLPSAIMPKTVPYNVLKDIVPISQIAVEPLILYVRSDSEFKSMEDLVAFARKNPGKLLAGASGVVTQNRINLELLKLTANVDIHFVSFSGGGEALLSVLGGHTHLSMSPLSICYPHIKAGKLRPLATCTPERSPVLPDIPTTKERGFPDVNLSMRFGMFGPKGLSPTIVDRLANTIEGMMKSREVLGIFDRFGYMVSFLGPAQLGTRMEKDLALSIDIAKKAKLEE